VSTDIGVGEDNDVTTATSSLARRPDGSWAPSAASSFGACNDREDEVPAQIVSVSVDPLSATLNIASTQGFTATGLAANGDPVPDATFTWSSSDTSVATVNANGVVLAVSAGDAIIRATAANGLSATASVHVNPGAPPSSSPVRFNEIHYDNLGTDSGEALEVEGPAGTDLSGYTIALYNGNGGGLYNTIALTGTLPDSCNGRGVAFVSLPQDGLQNGSPDGMALLDNTGALVEFRSYEGEFTASNGPAQTRRSVDIGAEQTNAPLGMSLQRNSTGAWIAALSTFGACNAEEPTNTEGHVFITGRTASDVALPVGFQDQLFARLVDFQNQTVATTFAWTSETPALASIEQNGVMTALGEGSAILRATAADGTTATITLPTRVAQASTTAVYGNNAEFGEPADGDASDDYIVRHPQYTASYNQNRGTPNWVSYNLEATHFGTEDRCDCFTMDPALPANFPQLTTADYTDAGAFHGYGIDRGHLARSFDRTSGGLDNANTYLFDNIVPQAADLNQGPWAMLENFLGDEARFNNREVYIVTGVAGNQGTIKDEGKIVIPASTWKVAVLLPRDHGLSDIRDYRDLEIIAVDMPNEPGVRNVDWSSYLTTVDAIEAATGYDLLAALPDEIEAAIESDTQPPLAAVSGTTELTEGGSASFDASGSLDPNGSIVSYHWDFGDGSTGEGASLAHVFAQDGVFVVTVTTTDDDGLTDTASLTVTVGNVAPVLAGIADGTLEEGDAYTVSGSFSDPGSDTWTATVNWGDGSVPSQAIVTTHDFSLVHVYANAGTYSVVVSIADDDASASGTHTLIVTSVVEPEPGIDLSQGLVLIDQLVAARKISRDFGNLMKGQVRSAQQLADQDKYCAAVMMLQTVQMEVDLLVRFRQITSADAAPLRGFLQQAITQLHQAKAAAEAAARAAKASKGKKSSHGRRGR
jgi:DNA/RNA endonuclease G (NUC1)